MLIPTTAATCCIVRRSRRSPITRSRRAGGIALLECGLELRSVNGSLCLARRTHSRARRSLIPASSDAARTDTPCSETRLNNSSRLAGQLRAFLWMFIRALPVSLFVLTRSEEHTSELQSRLHLVCRLLLEK